MESGDDVIKWRLTATCDRMKCCWIRILFRFLLRQECKANIQVILLAQRISRRGFKNCDTLVYRLARVCMVAVLLCEDVLGEEGSEDVLPTAETMVMVRWWVA